MKFFLPGIEDRAKADVYLESIAEFIGQPVPKRRIFRMSYRHAGQDMVAEVGRPASAYYGEGDEVVVAILGTDPFNVCLRNRGVIRGTPIYVGAWCVDELEYFDTDEPGPV
jgi:hypothetical protein